MTAPNKKFLFADMFKFCMYIFFKKINLVSIYNLAKRVFLVKSIHFIKAWNGVNIEEIIVHEIKRFVSKDFIFSRREESCF